MQIGNQFRAYPEGKVKETLCQWIGAQRHIYNAKVDEDRYYRRFARKSLQHTGLYAPIDRTYSQFKDDELTPWMKQIPSQILRNGAAKWGEAYMRHFAKLGGRPTKQKRSGRQSLTITQEVFRFVEQVSKDGETTHCIEIGTKHKPVGTFQFKAHRPYKIPNTIYVSLHAGKWFVSFSYDDGVIAPSISETVAHLKTFTKEELLERTIGADRGCEIPLATNKLGDFDFSQVQAQRMLKEQKYKKKWQRIQARRTKGSNRYRKACQRVAHYQRYGANVRNDYAHKTSYALTNTNDLIISFEDLKIKNMTRSAKGDVNNPGKNVSQKSGLNKSILLSAWGRVALYTTYKAQRKGKLVVKVSPSYSSQECSDCHHTSQDNRKTQSDFVCICCGLTLNADTNASRVLAGRAVDQVLSSGFTGKKETVKVKKKVGRVSSEPLAEMPSAFTHEETVLDAPSNLLVAQLSQSRETPTISRRL